MLQKIREASSGWVAGLILGPLTVMFALWGINGSLSGQSDTYAARVTLKPGWFGTGFGAKYKDISPEQFRQRLEQERQVQRNRLKDKFDESAFEAIANKHEIMTHLVDRELLMAAATRDGLAISGQQLFDAIDSEPAFQTDGKFDPALYKERLSLLSPPSTPVQFEADRRDDLLIQALPQEIQTTGIAAAKEVDDAIRLSGQKRDLRYVALPVPADGPAPSDAELQAWYKAHATDYGIPEQVSLEYLEIDASTIAVPTAIDDQTLRQHYDEQKNRYVEPEQRLASHILISVPADASPAVDKAAQEKAAGLAAQARKPGADFASLARANSQDEGSKGLGGDLGWLAQSTIDQKAFANALYALKPGQISDPVRTNQGWHVIDLRDVRPGKQIPFETVRDQLLHEELKDAREKLFSDRSGQLVDLTLKDPTSLAPAAKVLGMTIQKTPLFTRSGGAGIAANANVVKTAFSSAVLEDGDNSDEIDLDSKDHEHMVVIRIGEHVVARTLPFAQVRDQVLAGLLADRRQKAAKAAAEGMLARAAKGETLDAIATSISAVVQTSTATTRNLTVPSADIVNAGFRLPRPVQGKPMQMAIAQLGAGQYALVEATKVTDGDPAAVDQATLGTVRKQFAEQARGGLDMRVYVDALRRQYQVKIADERL